MTRNLTVACACLLSWFVHAEETLYNGIRLPDEWPPNYETFPDTAAPPYLLDPPDVIPIDVGRQLFFDDFLIESTTMKRTYHRPVYHPDNPVLKPRRDYEMEGYGPFAAPYSGGVWFDPKDQLFKMWYMAGYTKHLCLATSTDGIKWTRPNLDVVKATNIVLKGGAPESNSLLMDLDEPDASRRFKYVYFKAGGDPPWAVMYRHSADGIHWSEPQWRSGQSGDRTTVFYNPFRKKHVFLIRAKAHASGRAKRYWETDDLNDSASVKWPGEGANRALTPLWVRSDPGRDFTRPEISDMPQLYHLDAMAYESVIVGLFAIHRGRFARRSDGRPVEPGRPKCNELTVGFSRDGFHWHRPEHETFLGVSEKRGSWRWGNIQPVGSLGLVVGDHIYFYVSARRGDPELTNATEWIHDANASTGLAIMRRDGFASMDSDGQIRTLTTRPVKFSGKHLFVNVDSAEGELKVEVLDRSGTVLPPFAQQNCKSIRVNNTLHKVSWNGVQDLASLTGRDLRFRFYLTDGRLYSFWVSPTVDGPSNGYVLGGGPGFSQHTDSAGKKSYFENGIPIAGVKSNPKVVTENEKAASVIPQDRLVMWLKADAIVGVADEGAVERWNDSSPGKFFSTQTNPSQRPRLIENAINGVSAVRFDGQDDCLMVDYCPGLLYSYYNSTLIAVVRTNKGGSIISHGHTNLSVSDHNKGTLSYSSAYQVFPSGKHVWPGVRSTGTAAVPLGRPTVVAMRRSGSGTGATELFVDGKKDDDRTPIDYHPMNSTNGFIGAGYLGKRNHWRGDIAEIILYGRDLSDAELKQVESYLTGKYKLNEAE